MLLGHVVLTQAARLWRGRQRTEHQAAALFARLADDLATTGAGVALVLAARQASADETRHAQRCRALAEQFDRSSSAPPVHAWPTLGPAGMEPGPRALYTAVALSCVTETLSAGLLERMRAVTRHEQVRATVNEILRDEISHARIGWAHLAAQCRRTDITWLSPHLPGMLRACVQDEAGPASDGDAQPDLSEYGILPRVEVRRVLKGIADDVLLPGLEEFGVNTGPLRAELSLILG